MYQKFGKIILECFTWSLKFLFQIQFKFKMLVKKADKIDLYPYFKNMCSFGSSYLMHKMKGFEKYISCCNQENGLSYVTFI